MLTKISESVKALVAVGRSPLRRLQCLLCAAVPAVPVWPPLWKDVLQGCSTHDRVRMQLQWLAVATALLESYASRVLSQES